MVVLNIFKRVVSTSMALLTALLVVEVKPTNAEELESVDSIIINEDVYATNDLLWEEDDNSIPELNPEDFGISTEMYALRPSRFDISTDSATSKYLPPVGDQGEIQSCVAWATTYYQFTYEVNKLRGISTGTDGSNIYSPAFVYNYVNGGTNSQIMPYQAYDILRQHGAMKLADFPHDNNNYSYEWPNDEKKMIEALNYRATNASIELDPKSKSAPTSSTEFEIVKSMIANEHIAVVSMKINECKYGKTSDGELCVVRGNKVSSGSHAMAVVGYDDNIKITAGGETLTGAFKLINSFGTDWGNNGFIWVAYDALNPTSVHESAWNYSETRDSIFGNKNTFYFITPYECDVNFAGIVSLKSENKWGIKYYGNKGSTVDKTKWESDKTLKTSNYATYKMAFDFYEIGESFNIDDCLTSFWTFQTKGNSNYKTDNISYKIVDNLNNKIAPNYGVSGSLASTGTFLCPIYVQIAKGRVRYYDSLPITSEDSLAVMSYISEKIVFSNLQKKLADYNNDGEVDIIDVIAMNKHIANANGASYQISDYIEEWGCSLEDIIQEEYNMTVNDFLINNYAELESNSLLSVCS